MQLTQTNTGLTFKRAIKGAFICSLVVMTALGAIVAGTVTKQREASGDVLLELCKKKANGQWVVIDRAKGKVTASASVLDVAKGKEFKSNLTWDNRSEQGRQISVKQIGEGKATVDPASGEVNLEIPFIINVDGRTLSLTAKLTNQPTTTPVGTVTSKRLEIRGTTLSAGVAGVIEIREPSVVEALLNEPTAGPIVSDNKGMKERPLQPSAPDKKGLKENRPTLTKPAADSVIVVIKAQGSSTER